MLEIGTYTETKLVSKTDRTEKHGDDEVPAVSLGLSLTLPNTFLDCIDPNLRPMMFKADATKDLPGVESALTVLRCHSVDLFVLAVSHEGWTLYVDDGIDNTTELVFGSCKVDKLTVEPMNGGSVVLRMRVGTSDVDPHKFGVLGMHLGKSVWTKLIAPKAGETRAETKKTKKGKAPATNAEPSAGDLFAENVAAEDAKKAEEAKKADDAAKAEGGPWPFPGGEKPADAPPAHLAEPKTTKAERKTIEKAAARKTAAKKAAAKRARR